MAYRCNVCGTYVPDGTLHSCGGSYPTTNPYVYPSVPINPVSTTTTIQPWFDNAALNRIAIALERIAEALASKGEPETQGNEVKNDT